jgi:DNA-binding CsgD family transcriptional regulator
VILANLTEDATLEQIARRLYVTRNTVKTQVRSVYRKLGVSSRAEAVAKASEFQIAV